MPGNPQTTYRPSKQPLSPEASAIWNRLRHLILTPEQIKRDFYVIKGDNYV